MKIPFDYEQAVRSRNIATVKNYKKQIEKIAGRFTAMYRSPNEVIIGFIGSAFSDDLNEIQLLHICGFYGIPAASARFESIKTIDPKITKYHISNYNDFLSITFLPCAKCADNWKRERGVCNGGIGACKAFMDYVSSREEARG